jgi:hypothetical protein
MNKRAERKYEKLTDAYIGEMDAVDAPASTYRGAMRDAIERLKTCVQASEETSGDDEDEE